jgi:hypothetical protein
VRLAKNGILGLLDIPHFGRGQYENNSVKQLMAVTHGRYMWLEQLISIDVDIIAYITGSPSRGEDPTHFLEDKTKEKELADEMKNKYGTKRGSRRIIIKCISDVVKRMATKIISCKLLSKCHKEKVLAGVFVATTQCEEGTTLNWAPYLLNMFLDNCKDMQDLGIKFHYSWLLILIALIIWKEPKYSFFSTRPNPCHRMRYLSLGSTSNPKNKKVNAAIFEGYLNNL